MARPLDDLLDVARITRGRSGYGQDADVEAALGAGFDEHLTKLTPQAQQA